jgi:hypothetical protein
MSSATHSGHFGVVFDRAAPVASGACTSLRNLGRRILDALEERRQREVEEEFARLLAQSGGRLTDSVEREMMRKALGSGGGLTL